MLRFRIQRYHEGLSIDAVYSIYLFSLLAGTDPIRCAFSYNVLQSTKKFVIVFSACLFRYKGVHSYLVIQVSLVLVELLGALDKEQDVGEGPDGILIAAHHHVGEADVVTGGYVTC